MIAWGVARPVLLTAVALKALEPVLLTAVGLKAFVPRCPESSVVWPVERWAAVEEAMLVLEQGLRRPAPVPEDGPMRVKSRCS